MAGSSQLLIIPECQSWSAPIIPGKKKTPPPPNHHPTLSSTRLYLSPVRRTPPLSGRHTPATMVGGVAMQDGLTKGRTDKTDRHVAV
ncbi:hypothetical protein EYF80_025176 [Liparis tanakae]|uniref:Uncharacterized protein n=1 Tax=Liparis tanakae TaxID=230148 RepID=A0A4Z2HFC3_9TELE|nr:hypothetical protein EYF80_025176 [Liparis tanakae]